MTNFVHLHNHSDHSMLDGLMTPATMARVAAEHGAPAIGITDHGTLTGTYDLAQACAKEGIKPILGIESYVAPGSRFDRTPMFFGPTDDHGKPLHGRDDVSGGGAYTHISLWAENNDGLRNLMRLSEASNSPDAYYFKPRIDAMLLAEHADGLIGTTGCPSGEVQTHLRLGQYDRAIAAAARMRDILGDGNYYLELMDHGLDIETRTREDLLRLAKELGLPLLATNDCHYAHADDAATHALFLAMQSGKPLGDPAAFAFDGDSYYLRTSEQMRALFAEHPDACDNTLLIAERCTANFEHTNLSPVAPTADGTDEMTELITLTRAGLESRYGTVTPELLDRAGYELDVIDGTGFPGYFLIVADLVNWAKSQGILTGPGRGSAGGSVVAYALGITDIDPLAHGLLFERFLNPDRVSPPDIDLDFPDDRRAEVIDYLVNRYGSDKVSQIGTINRLKAKAALKDVGKALQVPYKDMDALARTYPDAIAGFGMSLEQVYDPEHERYNEAEEFRAHVAGAGLENVVESARSVEGFAKTRGLHAAGVLISREPLADHVPLMRRTGARANDEDAGLIAGFEYPTCESLGILKVDVLGVKVLGVVAATLDAIRINHGIDLTMDGILADLTDTKTYELLASGRTRGVFQLESSGIQALLTSMQPDRFEDISAVLALYRPGPMGANAHNDYADRKTGRKPITPIHTEFSESLADILNPTQGVVVYQEQIMAIAQRVAGYSLGQADLLRRAMGKKKKEILDAEYVPFCEGARANGYTDNAIATLWSILVPFASYSFNQAHTVGYGLVSYLTAYLKAHYPTEFLAAMLNAHSSNAAKVAGLLADCAAFGVRVLPPDINKSGHGYTPTADGSIVTGLASVKKVGVKVADAIIAEREAGGMFGSVQDFLYRLPSRQVNRAATEALASVGAFDGIADALISAEKELGALGMFDSRVAVADAVARERLINGPFTDVTSTVSRLGEYCPTGGVEDSLSVACGLHRARAVAVCEALAKPRTKSTTGGVSNPLGELFSVNPLLDVPVPDAEPWETLTVLHMERELLGRCVSGHYIDPHANTVRALGVPAIANALDDDSGDDADDDSAGERDVDVVGVMMGKQVKKSRAGREYVKFRLEDATGGIEVMVFGKHVAKVKSVSEFTLVRVTGALKPGDGTVLASQVSFPAAMESSGASTAPVQIRLTQDAWDGERDAVLDALAALIDAHPGVRPVLLVVVDALGRTREVSLPDDLRVHTSQAFAADARERLARFRPVESVAV